ncbi:uncharacterized protein F4822DRAFT_429550 [Hypoxylon trugodes]|uniref:uncharacterized protein n=1 Tax=Hypoxylon trugodes TaxID=326681 RepID=UPI00219051A6|nr:uncharacterized protein F4822DRAFT_429550 [Hypoxylon trugodes]KAI1388934.1 hypothetical protein F4822DRAFT_429550 [Hypoxylon trugodes]
MSMRTDPSIVLSDSSKTPQTSNVSHSLHKYLQSPPTSVTERLVASEKPKNPEDSLQRAKDYLESWSSKYDKAGKPKG